MFTTEAKELLQKWREENTRNSETVRDLWLTLDLAKFLGDESQTYLSLFILILTDFV